MEKYVKLSLEQRQINISEEELNNLTKRWRILTRMKENISELPGTIDIAIQNVPRGREE